MIRTVCSSRLSGGEEFALWRVEVEAPGDREPFSNKALQCHCVQVKLVLRPTPIVVHVTAVV